MSRFLLAVLDRIQDDAIDEAKINEVELTEVDYVL